MAKFKLILLPLFVILFTLPVYADLSPPTTTGGGDCENCDTADLATSLTTENGGIIIAEEPTEFTQFLEMIPTLGGATGTVTGFGNMVMYNTDTPRTPSGVFGAVHVTNNVYAIDTYMTGLMLQSTSTSGVMISVKDENNADLFVVNTGDPALIVGATEEGYSTFEINRSTGALRLGPHDNDSPDMLNSWVLPVAKGTEGQVLTQGADGVADWEDASGGASTLGELTDTSLDGGFAAYSVLIGDGTDSFDDGFLDRLYDSTGTVYLTTTNDSNTAKLSSSSSNLRIMANGGVIRIGSENEYNDTELLSISETWTDDSYDNLQAMSWLTSWEPSVTPDAGDSFEQLYTLHDYTSDDPIAQVIDFRLRARNYATSPATTNVGSLVCLKAGTYTHTNGKTGRADAIYAQNYLYDDTGNTPEANEMCTLFGANVVNEGILNDYAFGLQLRALQVDSGKTSAIGDNAQVVGAEIFPTNISSGGGTELTIGSNVDVIGVVIYNPNTNNLSGSWNDVTLLNIADPEGIGSGNNRALYCQGIAYFTNTIQQDRSTSDAGAVGGESTSLCRTYTANLTADRSGAFYGVDIQHSDNNELGTVGGGVQSALSLSVTNNNVGLDGSGYTWETSTALRISMQGNNSLGSVAGKIGDMNAIKIAQFRLGDLGYGEARIIRIDKQYWDKATVTTGYPYHVFYADELQLQGTGRLQYGWTGIHLKAPNVLSGYSGGNLSALIGLHLEGPTDGNATYNFPSYTAIQVDADADTMSGAKYGLYVGALTNGGSNYGVYSVSPIKTDAQIELGVLGDAPGSTNGMVWVESDAVHAYYGDAEHSLLADGNIELECTLVTTLTDDAINTAINALSSGGCVELVEGEYVVDDGVLINQSNITIKGTGRGTVLKIADGTNTDIKNVITNMYLADEGSYYSVNGLVLRDFAIDGNASNQSSGTHDAVDIVEMDNVIIDNLYIHDMNNRYITINDTPATGSNNPYYITIVNSEFVGDGDTDYLIYIDDTQDVMIKNNILASAGMGIRVNCYSGGEGRAIISENSMDDVHGGIYLNGASRHVISNNVINSDQGVLATYDSGIRTEVTQAVVSGNVIYNTNGSALYFTGNSNYMQVFGNMLYNCGTAGTNTVYIGGDYVTFSGNTIIDSTGSAGILLDTNADEDIVQNNQLYGSVAIIVTDSGAVGDNYVSVWNTTNGNLEVNSGFKSVGSIYSNITEPDLTGVAAYTIDAGSYDDYMVVLDDGDATGEVTVTLPAAASSTGRVLVIKKIGATYNVVVDGASDETIDGAANKTLSTQYDSITIQCDGTTWWVQ